jgi:hypothetical protein
MKTTAFLLAAALLVPAAGAFAQSQSFVPDEQELTGQHAAPQAAATQPAALTGPSVTYFGVVSTHDATHEQFARLRQAFEASQPTVVFYEKPDMGVDSTETATIGRFGESGYVRYLAQQHGVPAERLDDPVADYEYLKTVVDAEQLKLYYLLRATQQFRHNTGASKALTKQAMKARIRCSSAFLPGIEGVIHNMAEFNAAYRKYCPTGGQWWQQPTAGAFVQRLNDSLSAFCAQRLASRLAEKLQAGERVLVVLDPSHLPAQAPYAVNTQASR